MKNTSVLNSEAHARIELTRYDIDRVLHFAHPIPFKHNWHQRHLDEHHGRWDWNDMMAMLRHAEVLIDRPGGQRCHWKLKKLTATSPTKVHVEWDPDVTVDDDRFYHQGKEHRFQLARLEHDRRRGPRCRQRQWINRLCSHQDREHWWQSNRLNPSPKLASKLTLGRTGQRPDRRPDPSTGCKITSANLSGRPPRPFVVAPGALG